MVRGDGKKDKNLQKGLITVLCLISLFLKKENYTLLSVRPVPPESANKGVENLSASTRNRPHVL